MNKKVIISIVVVLLILGVAIAYAMHQKKLESHADDIRLPGDFMTEKAIENAASGKQPMDGESLPTEDKPKPNNLQGEGAMQGGVIIEGPADL